MQLQKVQSDVRARSSFSAMQRLSPERSFIRAPMCGLQTDRSRWLISKILMRDKPA